MGNSPRPGLWTLEKSSDYGKTWFPWQHFSDSPSDCEIYFGKDSLKPIRKDDDIICTTEFSKIVPLESGEVSRKNALGSALADDEIFTDHRSIAHWTSIGQQLLQLDGLARVDASHERSNPLAANKEPAGTSDERREARPDGDPSLLLLDQRYFHRRSLRVQWTRQHLFPARPARAVAKIAGLLVSTQHLRHPMRAVLSRIRAEEVETEHQRLAVPMRA